MAGGGSVVGVSDGVLAVSASLPKSTNSPNLGFGGPAALADKGTSAVPVHSAECCWRCDPSTSVPHLPHLNCAPAARTGTTFEVGRGVRERGDGSDGMAWWAKSSGVAEANSSKGTLGFGETGCSSMGRRLPADLPLSAGCQSLSGTWGAGRFVTGAGLSLPGACWTVLVGDGEAGARRCGETDLEAPVPPGPVAQAERFRWRRSASGPFRAFQYISSIAACCTSTLADKRSNAVLKLLQRSVTRTRNSSPLLPSAASMTTEILSLVCEIRRSMTLRRPSIACNLAVCHSRTHVFGNSRCCVEPPVPGSAEAAPLPC